MSINLYTASKNERRSLPSDGAYILTISKTKLSVLIHKCRQRPLTIDEYEITEYFVTK